MTTDRSQRCRKKRGFSFVEVMLAAAMGLVAIGVAVQSSATADTLAAATRVLLHSSAKHRRNHRAVSNVLRAADVSTLSAFDEHGVSTEPHFERVTGQALGQRLLGGVVCLEWRLATPDPHPHGPKRLGHVYLVAPDATSSLVARDVPQDSFYVRREGRNLVVGLATSYIVDDYKSHTMATESVVTLRN